MVLVALVAAAFANIIFGGRSLVVSENFPPFGQRVDETALSRRGLVAYPNYRDPDASRLQMEPAAEFLRRSLGRGELPLWDPYVGGGMPAFATLLPQYLFPPSLLVVLLGNGSGVRNAYILILIAASAWLTYRLLRHHGLSWQASLAGGIAFAFSGAVIQTAPSGLGQPIAFFSLPLLVTARLIDKPSARRAAELAAAFAFVALASFPPVLLQVFGTCVIYLLLALAFRRGDRISMASWFGAGAAIGMAIVAVAYLPAFFVMAEARHIARAYTHAAEATLLPLQVMQLLSPTIMGGAAVYAKPALVGPMGHHLYYTGVVALFLSGVGFLARSPELARVLKWMAIVAGGLALAKVFGIPPVQGIAEVPLLRNIHYAAYFGILVAYSVAILAALGVDALVSGRARWWQIAASVATLGAALLLLWIFAVRYRVGLHPEAWRWIADFRMLVVFALLAAASAFFAGSRAAAAALLAVLSVEGALNAMYPRQRRWDVWNHPPPYVELLTKRGSGGRVLPMQVYPANTQSVYRQPTLDSLTLFTSERMFELYKRYFSPAMTHFQVGTRSIPPEGVLDAANIEYVVMKPGDANGVDVARRGYELLHAGPAARVFRRETAPRYSFTSAYEVVPPGETLEALSYLRRGTVLLERRPAFPSIAASSAPPRVTRFALNEVEVVVDAPRAGMLVCSESRMSGWTATVDGKPAAIVPANHAFRAIELRPGRHVVRLRYRPPGLVPGSILSVAGLIAGFALSAATRFIVRRPYPDQRTELR